MANANPPKKNQAFTMYVALPDFLNHGVFKSSPTIGAGDFKVSKDGGAFANLATLPTVTPAASVSVQIALSATEMNADQVLVVAQDQTDPPEWAAWSICINTTA